MRKSECILLGLILLSSGWIEGGKSLSAHQSPQVKAPAPKETGQCTLTFQYVEGPGLLLAQKPGAHGRPIVISANERTAWLAKVQGKPDVWMMKEPVNKYHSFGPARQASSLSGGQKWAASDCFGVKESSFSVCSYQVTTKGMGAKVALDLAVSASLDEGKGIVGFGDHADLELAEGDTLVLQSPHHPRKNVDCVMLVTAKNRSLPLPRVVRLELLQIEGDLATTLRPSWNFDGRYQCGVPKMEVEKWFRKSGTTLEAQASKRTFKDLKNTESWTIVDNKYDAPTETYFEMVGVLAELFLLKKITMVDFTEEDRITKHEIKIELHPDPANESSALPFFLRSDVMHQRGDRSGGGSRSTTVPKPGHYLAVDTTKPQDRTWTMLLIRAVEDGGF